MAALAHIHVHKCMYAFIKKKFEQRLSLHTVYRMYLANKLHDFRQVLFFL